MICVRWLVASISARMMAYNTETKGSTDHDHDRLNGPMRLQVNHQVIHAPISETSHLGLSLVYNQYIESAGPGLYYTIQPTAVGSAMYSIPPIKSRGGGEHTLPPPKPIDLPQAFPTTSPQGIKTSPARNRVQYLSFHWKKSCDFLT